jgi:hypothetical protein
MDQLGRLAKLAVDEHQQERTYNECVVQSIDVDDDVDDDDGRKLEVAPLSPRAL